MEKHQKPKPRKRGRPEPTEKDFTVIVSTDHSNPLLEFEQAKYIGNAPVPIKDINDLFDSRWKFLGETNLPFQVRVNERHWMTFLSHTVAYQLTNS